MQDLVLVYPATGGFRANAGIVAVAHATTDGHATVTVDAKGAVAVRQRMLEGSSPVHRRTLTPATRRLESRRTTHRGQMPEQSPAATGASPSPPPPGIRGTVTIWHRRTLSVTTADTSNPRVNIRMTAVENISPGRRPQHDNLYPQSRDLNMGGEFD